MQDVKNATHLEFPPSPAVVSEDASGTSVPHTVGGTSGKNKLAVGPLMAAHVLQTFSASVPSYMARYSDRAHAEKSSRVETSDSLISPFGPEVTCTYPQH